VSTHPFASSEFLQHVVRYGKDVNTLKTWQPTVACTVKVRIDGHRSHQRTDINVDLSPSVWIERLTNGQQSTDSITTRCTERQSRLYGGNLVAKQLITSYAFAIALT